MTPPSADLDTLRREIDEVDDRLHRTLIERAELMQRIVAAGRNRAANDDGNAVFMRPGREAEMLRRRLAEHNGTMPAAVVARVWRELIGTAGQQQEPLRVLVHAPSKSVGYWDLARNHFGSVARMSMHTSAQRVLTDVAEGDGAVGMLTLPEENEPNPWWPHIMGGDEARLQVIARLPFFASATGRFEDLAALVVAPFAPEESGDDISLIAIQASDLSRARVGDLLAGAGFDGRIISSFDPGHGADRLHLVEIPGYVSKTDPRIEALAQASEKEIQRVVALGAYALPLGQLD